MIVDYNLNRAKTLYEAWRSTQPESSKLRTWEQLSPVEQSSWIQKSTPMMLNEADETV